MRELEGYPQMDNIFTTKDTKVALRNVGDGTIVKATITKIAGCLG